VRFDGDRAYAITYNQTDPLFTIDLSDPSHPKQRGQLFMPGFQFYLEPHGDRVIGLGIDRTDPNGSMNVSLFDVSNMDAPTMIKRVSFATPNISEDYEILSSEVSEDQDRIQKAFHVFDDGTVVVPFNALRPNSYYYSSNNYSTYDNSACDNVGGGIQLISWRNDTLIKDELLAMPGNPRRAFELRDEIIAVSDSNVRSYSRAYPGVAHLNADITIGECVVDSPTYSYGGGGYYYPYRGGGEGYACSSSPSRGSASSAVLVGLALLAIRRRRR
jgi:uncharacterized protein (TIGR03382 family)